jgi:hypothetical protein
MHFGRHHEHDAGDHRDGEHIVELMRVPGRFEADVNAAALAARGIKASAAGSAAVFAPRVSRFPTNQVFVFENDREIARALVAEESPDDDGTVNEP